MIQHRRGRINASVRETLSSNSERLSFAVSTASGAYLENLLPCLRMCASMIQHIVKRDFDSGVGLQTSFSLGNCWREREHVGRSYPSCHSGFYIASYGKAVNFNNSREPSGSLFFSEVRCGWLCYAANADWKIFSEMANTGGSCVFSNYFTRAAFLV